MAHGVIKMFKVHSLQKSRRSLSMKYDVSLDELEKAAKAPKKSSGTSEGRPLAYL